jgi:hypothetical protein
MKFGPQNLWTLNDLMQASIKLYEQNWNLQNSSNILKHQYFSSIEASSLQNKQFILEEQCHLYKINGICLFKHNSTK